VGICLRRAAAAALCRGVHEFARRQFCGRSWDLGTDTQGLRLPIGSRGRGAWFGKNAVGAEIALVGRGLIEI